MAEPMTLGSPPNSPSPGSQYLPSYLIGEQNGNTSQSTPRLWSAVGTPTKTFTGSSLSPSTPVVQPSSCLAAVGSTSFGRSNIFMSSRGDISERNLLSSQPTDKAGGPPVQSLFDNLATPQSQTHAKSKVPCVTLLNSPVPSVEGSFHSTGVLMPSRSLNESSKPAPSPAQVYPFDNQGNSLISNDELETWVTVFGFPVASASYILQQFSLYGTVVEHKVSPCGNWMHIKYQSKLQAKKALSKNGKVFGESIMVGVKSCKGKELKDESSKENSMFGVSTPSHQMNGDLNRSNRVANIRPLTQAYRTAVSQHEVTPHNQTPQKTNNIISKAMEYAFGW
ncbi:nucleoporin NUP35-like [Tachypleus tridentatus]|uniref:nucleoporin NUP35-like n=1 Tax=Tachypleus tridentatus TaxID=6853 RepID=UPI003FD69962